jgi:NAD(P)H-hydrate epimerase
MATAGTGDVLTGIAAALLAQKMPPNEAAPLAVYLHGRAGELAAEKYTSYSMIASDLIKYLPKAFAELY